MNDVLKMQLDIQNNLEKEIKKNSKAMGGFNSFIEKSQQEFKKLDRQINKTLAPLAAMRDTLREIVPLVGTVFSTAIIMDSVRNVLFMDKAITQLSFRMGHGAEGTHALKNAVYGLNAELGIGIENAEDLVSELVNLRIPLDMINQMAKSVGMLSEITGVSADQAAELGGNLVRIGRLGQKSVDGIFASMVGVQRAVGLTRNEMNSLSRTISNSTQMLNQMGKSAGQIEKYNRGIIKLAASFASVGVEAERILGIMDELLDPGEVQKHAFLLSKLGVSLGDAFEGNIDPEQLISGFRDLGQTISGMTGPAAAAMAQQLGMSVRDLRQMGTLGDEDLSKIAGAMNDGASASEAMSEAFKEQETPLLRFERTMERIKGFIGEMAEKTMPYIEKAFEWLSNNAEGLKNNFLKFVNFITKIPDMLKNSIPLLAAGFLILFTLVRRQLTAFFTRPTSDAFSTGVSEGIKQGTRKGILSMKKEFAGAGDIDLRARVEGKEGFKAMMADAELLEIRASGMGGFFGNVMRNTAQMHRNLALSADSIVMFGDKAESIGKTMAGNLEIAKNERSTIEGAFQARMESYNQEAEALRIRREALEEIKLGKIEGRKLTGEEAYELRAISVIEKRRNQLLAKEEKKLSDFKEYNAKKQDRLIEGLTNNQLVQMSVVENQALQNAESRKNAILKRQETEINNYNALKSAEEELKKIQGIAEDERIKRQEYLTKKIEESTALKSEITLELSNQNSELENMEKRLETINRVSRDRNLIGKEGEITLERASSLLGKSTNLAATAGRRIVNSVAQATDDFIMGARNAASAFADRFRRENIGATLRGALRGIGGITTKALAPLIKVLGPLVLIGALMRIFKNMAPVQESMVKVQEKVQKGIQKLEPTIGKLMTILVDNFLPFIEYLIDGLVKVVEFLIPPFMKVVSFFLTAIGTTINWLGKIFPSLRGAGDKMLEAAETIKSSADDLAVQIRNDGIERRRVERLRQGFDQTLQNVLLDSEVIKLGVTQEQIEKGVLNTGQLEAVEAALQRNSDELAKAFYEANKEKIEQDVKDLISATRETFRSFSTENEELLKASIRESLTENEEHLQRVMRNTGLSLETIAEQMVTSFHGPSDEFNRSFLETTRRIEDLDKEIRQGDISHDRHDELMLEREMLTNKLMVEGAFSRDVERFALNTQEAIERGLGIGKDNIWANIFRGQLNRENADIISESIGEQSQQQAEQATASLKEFTRQMQALRGTTADLPEEIAGELRANEVRRSWTPAQLRALSGGEEFQIIQEGTLSTSENDPLIQKLNELIQVEIQTQEISDSIKESSSATATHTDPESPANQQYRNTVIDFATISGGLSRRQVEASM